MVDLRHKKIKETQERAFKVQLFSNIKIFWY